MKFLKKRSHPQIIRNTFEKKVKWSAHYSDWVHKVAILVTKAPHCLHDLLLRQQQGELNCEISTIISNHPTLEAAADQYRIPFHCLPLKAWTKPQQEKELLNLLITSLKLQLY